MSKSFEIPFRIAFGMLWVLYFGIRLFYQKKVKSDQDYDLVNEKAEKLRFRLFAIAYLLLPIYFITAWVDFAHLPFPGWLRWIGSAITCAGIGLFGWSHQALGNNWTAILALSKEHKLIESGPFRYVRHPMYAAFFLIGIGFFLVSANWLVGSIYIIPLWVMYSARVSQEEKMMLEHFGEDYRRYMKRTGRLFPHI